MSPSYCVRIAGSPARVIYQPTSSSSLISSSYLSAISSTASTRGTVNLSVSVATTTGFFTSVIDFNVTDTTAPVDGLSIDAVLGRDWLGICLAMANDGTVSFLPTTGEHSFQTSRAVARSVDEWRDPGCQPSKSQAFHEPEPVSYPKSQALRESEPVAVDLNATSFNRDFDMRNPLLCPNAESPMSASADDADERNHASSSANIITSQLPLNGSDYLTDVILKRRSTGVRSSAFTSDICSVRRSLDLHGLTASDDDITSCRTRLLYHIFTGGCVSNGLERSRQTACNHLSTGFPSAHSLASFAFNVLLNTAAEATVETEHLMAVAHCLGMSRLTNVHNPRRQTLTYLRQHCHKYRTDLSCSASLNTFPQSDAITLENAFKDFDSLPKESLQAEAALHGISLQPRIKKPQIVSLLVAHLCLGECSRVDSQTYSACSQLRQEYLQTSDPLDRLLDLNEALPMDILTKIQPKMGVKSLRNVFRVLNIPFSDSDGVKILRKALKHHIKVWRRGKRAALPERQRQLDHADLCQQRQEISDSWPQPVPQTLKDKLLQAFRDETSSAALSTSPCAACSESCLRSKLHQLRFDDFNLDLLRRPDRRPLDESEGTDIVVDDLWLDADCYAPAMPSLGLGLHDLLLHPEGVNKDEDTGAATSITVCGTCRSSLQSNKVPPLALANHTYLGAVPKELRDLTMVEEAMIARCRSKVMVMQLKENNEDDSPVIEELSASKSEITQRGMKGHVIMYPQNPSRLATVLPPSLEEVSTPICVLFIGSSPPTQEWLDKAKPLYVRREKVRAALIWLKAHNTHYKHVHIDHILLDSFPEAQTLPVHVEHILPNRGADVLTSRYDQSPTSSEPEHERNSALNTSSTDLNVAIGERPTGEDIIGDLDAIPFQNIVITDVDGHAPSNELRAAAFRHVRHQGGGYFQLPHSPTPVNEFDNPALFPMMYPCLFPYGIGGFDDIKRTTPLSMKRHVKHLFNLHDRRFQEHYSFLFSTFNVLQRRELLMRTSLKVKKANFPDIAASFASVSPEAVHVMSERIARGDMTTHNEDERKVLTLMQQVNVVTNHVPGSSAARLSMRNEIRGLMMEKGLPSFYVTINPADSFNPLVSFLAGSEIDIDELLPVEVPSSRQQSLMVAKNPSIAAKFFNIYMKAFISTILGFDPKKENLEGGILGVVKAYYGCVEAQGRGTLHCHMLIWVEGGLNPNEIKKRVSEDGDVEFGNRLMAFLDDTISNCIPEDPESSAPKNPSHPCSIRGVNLKSSESQSQSSIEHARKRDIHALVEKCQVHDHRKTCFKYCKDTDVQECRFGLSDDPAAIIPDSHFDSETGELCLRCLDGMVNNFNATILEAMRCNMDITFVGSGQSAKAIIYYITDYITKSQLKTHVAYAALDLAVKKLGEYNPEDDDIAIRAKKLLQKCAYSMISNQELSGPQVCSYLMDFEDHFTSHKYRHLFWTSFERFVNEADPSPECYEPQVDRDAPQDIPEPAQLNDPEHDDEHEFTVDRALTPDHDDTQEIGLDAPVDDDSEVTIAIQSDRQLVEVARASQVADYQMRDNSLQGICVWDYVARVEKIKNGRKHQSPRDPDDDDDMDLDNDEESESTTVPDVARSIEDILADRHKRRPRASLQSGHQDSSSHFLRVCLPNSRLVPVPIGPRIPRRDVQEVRERYCRLMLILFKPWSKISDLREPSMPWSTAFDQFMLTCPAHLASVMDNMQILHECKDSRDDHFARRSQRRRNRTNAVVSDHARTRQINDDFVGPDDTENEILNHMRSIQSSATAKALKDQQILISCLQHADAGSLFSGEVDPVLAQPDPSLREKQIYENKPLLEEQWRATYELRRKKWKMSASANPSNTIDSAVNDNEDLAGVQDGSAFRTAHEQEPMEPSLQQEIPASSLDSPVDIESIIREFTLNAEQARAFRIVASHSLKPKVGTDPLRMYLGGPGGTGKSRVINALKVFFERRNQSRRFRLASYTGVAAKNISGMTLHSALSLGQLTSSGMPAKTQRDLTAMWEGVDFLFIDEVSMIGCNLLTKVSRALCEAKQNLLPFGGINIIFAGDFAQLAPVGETRLYSHIDTRNAKVGTAYGQSSVFGKLLWLSVDTVVMLSQQMRQSGSENVEFVNLLNRMRVGECTTKDYHTLKSRLITNLEVDDSWKGSPIIVSDNKVKDALNVRATEAFAKRTGRELHWYYSRDTRGGQPITDEELVSHLQSLPSGRDTNYRLGKIPMVLGMPVMISQNFDVEGGVVNGCTGILREIRYQEVDGRRYAKSCVIEAESTTGAPLPHLPEKYVVALEDQVSMVFKHPQSNRKCTVQRKQVPIIPGFAMTAHKSQGQTMQTAIVDLESCYTTEAPYVMVSRVTSLKGLVILRPFRIKHIRYDLSGDRKKENKRLEILRLQTLYRHGVQQETRRARDMLKRYGATLQPIRPDHVDPDVETHSDRLQSLELLQRRYRPLTNVTDIIPFPDSEVAASNTVMATATATAEVNGQTSGSSAAARGKKRPYPTAASTSTSHPGVVATVSSSHEQHTSRKKRAYPGSIDISSPTAITITHDAQLISTSAVNATYSLLQVMPLDVDSLTYGASSRKRPYPSAQLPSQPMPTPAFPSSLSASTAALTGHSENDANNAIHLHPPTGSMSVQYDSTAQQHSFPTLSDSISTPSRRKRLYPRASPSTPPSSSPPLSLQTHPSSQRSSTHGPETDILDATEHAPFFTSRRREKRKWTADEQGREGSTSKRVRFE